MSGLHTDGNTSFLHYDVHSLYGWSETVATYKYVIKHTPKSNTLLVVRNMLKPLLSQGNEYF